VVAKDLVQLDELVSVVFEPGGEPAVQVGPRRLWQSIVRGVANQ
jgi:hypothetical protein